MTADTPRRARGAVAAGATVMAAACTGGALGGATHPATAAADVPAAYAAPVAQAGHQCPAVDAPLHAGVLDSLSDFDTEATSAAGAQGPAQLLPATWAAVGTHGQMIGAPGDGDPRDPDDATATLARVLCHLAADQHRQLAGGELSGDPTELMLAGFVAGEDAVTRAGGVPRIADIPREVAAMVAAADTYQERVQG